MRTFYPLMLVMLSISEAIFTGFYIYLAQKLDAIPLTGAILYLGSVLCLNDCYQREKYQRQKKKLIEKLFT